ncbi:hypothetical protein [Arcticibacterium luteifluviistationis]|uniref:Uncharacterized protein n=1 Tax=Arcticibacterium luteifluviistationis TaxID=1784714 RepID=A0A2Z4GD36_9BACT|nr:hypothetical protein [Arcticibacterium luteifluviistationis]AWV99146.1 hypothetical protein DJ013_13600 [Arcticibacterium luteifluviistationis]
MNSKFIMTASSVFLGLAAVLFTFLPQEVVGFLGLESGNTIILQILGALYFGFAMLNWMGKSSLIGGIYGRPVALGNFSHFAIAGIALLKLFIKAPDFGGMVVLTLFYLTFAVLFGLVLFGKLLK